MPTMSERIDIRLTDRIVTDLCAIRKALGLTSTSATVRHVLGIGIAVLADQRFLIRWPEIEHIRNDLHRIAGVLSRQKPGDERMISTLSQVNGVLERLERAIR